jgi:hypothetical protein
MLPITVQFLVAMLAYGLNERMARKADYLREENRVLKEAIRAATGKTRIPLTDEQRRRLAAKGKALTPTEHEECARLYGPPPSWRGSDSSSLGSTTAPESESLADPGRRTKSGSWFSVSPVRTRVMWSPL